MKKLFCILGGYIITEERNNLSWQLYKQPFY